MPSQTALAGIVGAFVFAGCCTSDPKPIDPFAPEVVSSAAKIRPARCKAIGREQVIGRESDEGGHLDKILPFATEVGEGVAFNSGFAVGALRQEGKGTRAIVVSANLEGTAWQTIELDSSHGDAEAPHVFARENKLGVAMLEPSGATRTLRLAQVVRDEVKWGAELLQGRDESLAYDVVIGENTGIAVWDDVPKRLEVSAVFLSTFDATSFASADVAKVVTLPGTDAEMPRVVERPGGFWLFWLARRSGSQRHDARYRAEDIAHRWVEAVPLDKAGKLSGTPVKLGSTSGHVLGYDIAGMPDGSVVVMWRDDDTPSGSAGGKLYRARVRLGGVDGPDAIEDEHHGIGAPNVMPGWYAIADALKPTRLAPMNPDGSLVDKLASEKILGAGEPVANREDVLFVSRPDGVAMRLFLVKCGRQFIDAGASDADFDAAIDAGAD